MQSTKNKEICVFTALHIFCCACTRCLLKRNLHEALHNTGYMQSVILCSALLVLCSSLLYIQHGGVHVQHAHLKEILDRNRG